MLRALYDWCIREAEKPRAAYTMGAISFAESSFFPIPPDAFLIPLCLARPDKAYRYAAVCTVTSVLGGIVGYFIGAVLYDTVGSWLVGLYGYGDKVEAFRASYNQWGAWIILLKGLTPIPYKIVTITSGFAGYDFWLFVLFSIITRGGRFFIVAALLHRYGAPVREMVEKRLTLWATIFVVVLVGGFILVTKVF